MKNSFPWSWQEVVLIVVLSPLVIGVIFYEKTPSWLRMLVGALVFIGPCVPVLALVPWHFVAKHRGLVSRSQIPCNVTMDAAFLHIERGSKQVSYAWANVVRARMAQNDNWTESTMLEDALGLFDARGREIDRIPESAVGFTALVAEISAREIPLDYVDVSAPAFLD